MKPIFSFFFCLVFLLLVSNVSYARKDPEDYWERRMNGQPMPEVIKDLVVQNQPSVSDAEKYQFVRDFDIKPNVILYHTHVVSKEEEKMKKEKEEKKENEPSVKKLEAEKGLNFKEEEEGLTEQAINKG